MHGASGTEPAVTAVAVRNLLPGAELKALTSVDTKAGLATIAVNWVITAAIIAVAIWIDAWWVSVLAVVLVAGRQHAMLVLMHDASHGLVCKDRTLNDTASNLLLSFPLFISTRLYRRHHLAHHRNTNTTDDPDIAETDIPDTLGQLLLQLCGDLIGLRSLYLLRSVGSFGVLGLYDRRNDGVRQIGSERLMFPLFLTGLVVALAVTNGWLVYAVYWFVPMWFVLPALLRVRAMSEHAGRTQAGLLDHARSVDANPLERALIAPFNIGLHLEHHLFPDVPFYRLARISRLLRDRPELNARTPRTRGYLFGRASVLGELYGTRPRPEEAKN